MEQAHCFDSQRCLAWASGPQTLKPLLFTVHEALWRAERDAEGRIQFVPAKPVVQKTAVLGVLAGVLGQLPQQIELLGISIASVDDFGVSPGGEIY